MATSSANKRIAKNAIALTFRTVLATIVGLYTSRVVLATLGVENYGIYGVVGSVVGMLSFLNSSFTAASSRYLSYEIGSNNQERLRQTFASSFRAHLIIALIVLFISETVGLWFLYNKVNIPSHSINAAKWVYQLSIISTLVSITQVPFNSVIISHEKMGFYAFIEILNVTLKLLIVYLLVLIPENKLILYAVLTLLVTIIMQSISIIYCIRFFHESRFYRIKDRQILKQLLSFSLLDLFGNFSVVVCNQGRIFLINIFFGVIYNAAVSIAETVQGMMSSLTNNVLMAFRPHIVKQYAKNNFYQMGRALRWGMVFSTVAYALMAIPCMLEADYILNLWLGMVPPYTVIFLRVIIFSCLLRIITSVFGIAIHATGNIKIISFINGTLILINPFIVWVFFKFGYAAWFAYIINAIMIIALDLIYFISLKIQIPKLPNKDIAIVTVKIYAFIAIAAIPTYYMRSTLTSSFLRLSCVVATYAFCLIFLVWHFIFTYQDRKGIKEKIQRSLHINTSTNID
jgi:O-antigen/teichoic acid export membrane protein